MPQALSSAINPNMLLGPTLAPDGGQAAMAHLLAMRSEVMTLHLSVKLFHCTPQELPEDAREQLTAWLRQAPACTELYVRSGCVHLTLTVITFSSPPSHMPTDLTTDLIAFHSLLANWQGVTDRDPASLYLP